MKPNLHLVIMAGGSGTRFWPKSTSKRPKQFLAFGGPSEFKESLVRQTLSRFDALVPRNQRTIVTTRALHDAMAVETPASEGISILAEPQGRNTAPCIYWAARVIAERDRKGVMLVMPADHFMSHPKEFVATVARAADWAAKNDDLVTLGVRPDRPETGYGYLKCGKSMGGECSRVEAFVEKPNATRAQEFLRAGNYLWNGGMFLWRAEIILKAFDAFMPEMKKAWDESGGDIERAYPKMTATSIDYGIMEKAKNVVTFPLDCGWDDVGSWTSLEGLAQVLGARHGTNTVTAGELVTVDSDGHIVDAPGKLVAILGVNDLIVVEAGDSILVAHKDRAQDIKQVVELVKQKRPDLA